MLLKNKQCIDCRQDFKLGDRLVPIYSMREDTSVMLNEPVGFVHAECPTLELDPIVVVSSLLSEVRDMIYAEHDWNATTRLCKCGMFFEASITGREVYRLHVAGLVIEHVRNRT